MVIIDSEKCIGCAACADDCIALNIEIKDGVAVLKKPCFQCGHCVAICPAGAVSIDDYDMNDVTEYTPENIITDPKKVLHSIKMRRSIRSYKKLPIEQEKLEKIVQAGRYTATGSNSQNCRFVVVQDGMDELKKMIWDYIDNGEDIPEERRAAFRRIGDKRENGIDFLFRNAPAVIYVASKSAVNAALAAQNIELAAVAQGLGVMYNGYLVGATNMNEKAVKWLDLEDKPVAVSMTIGYPSVKYQRSAPRKEADVRWR